MFASVNTPRSSTVSMSSTPQTDHPMISANVMQRTLFRTLIGSLTRFSRVTAGSWCE